MPTRPAVLERSIEIAAPVQAVFDFHVDVAERSPFALWRHEHIVRALGPDRTLLTDRVTYRLRGGRLGALAGRLLVRRRLEAAFAERQRRTRELLEA
jgi:ligand-binding SRPBCC domain-containing protein